MLIKIEAAGCRKILEKLSYPDLVSLVDTITKRQVKVSRTSEAMKAILEYSPSALDLLKRKKIRREFLFSYLAEEKVIVHPTIDKSALIRIILKRWGTDVQDFEMFDVADDASATDIENQATQPGSQPQSSSPQGINAGNQPPQFNIHVHQYCNVTNIRSETNSTQYGNVCEPSGLNNSSSVHPTHQTLQAVSSEVQILGEKFAEWFYENLNTHCPSYQKTPADFGPHHFWDDAYLILNSCTPEPNHEKVDGPVLVSQRLLAFSKDEQLLFNPNLTKDGIYVRSNPHGLLMILVCGTIHRNNQCLGVFQQVFGIVKDPRFENNWKIKMTKLEVKATQTFSVPKLEGNLDRQIMAV